MSASGTKDPRIDAYIAKSAPFARPILKHLRKIVHLGCPAVTETMKWSMPHFEYKGIMCGMAAHKRHCSFGFWKSELVLGEEKLAEEKGMGHFGCIKRLADLPPAGVLIEYVRKAAELNDAGVKSPWREKPREKSRAPLEVPDYFAAALKKNAKAKKTFDNFTPGKRKEYVQWVTEAKREETRNQRLATSMEWLAQGKPRMWKYLPQGS